MKEGFSHLNFLPHASNINSLVRPLYVNPINIHKMVVTSSRRGYWKKGSLREIFVPAEQESGNLYRITEMDFDIYGGGAVFCGWRFQACFSAVLNAVCGLGPPKLRFTMRFAFLRKFTGLRISWLFCPVCGSTENVIYAGCSVRVSRNEKITSIKVS